MFSPLMLNMFLLFLAFLRDTSRRPHDTTQNMYFQMSFAMPLAVALHKQNPAAR